MQSTNRQFGLVRLLLGFIQFRFVKEEYMEERKTNGIGYITGRWPLDPAKSTIVFVHGAGGSSAFWSAQVQGLAAQFNTIALDLPGHGRSSGGGNTKIEEYVRAVADFFKQVDMPAPIPCGLSMGGAITQQLLLDFRDQFNAGILISTGARLKVAPAIFEAIEKDYNGFVDMIAKLAASKKTDPGLIQPFKDDLTGCKPQITHGDFQACNRFNITDRLTSLDAPVLVLSAQDDKLTPPKYADFLEKTIKNAERAHIMDAGHVMPMEKPVEVNQAIADFLDRNGL
jgi:pimeloyl-ACP methyl ester carboxylesterase